MVRHPMVHLDYLDIFRSFGRGLLSSCVNTVQNVFMPVILEPWDHAMSTRFYLERNWTFSRSDSAQPIDAFYLSNREKFRKLVNLMLQKC